MIPRATESSESFKDVVTFAFKRSSACQLEEQIADRKERSWETCGESPAQTWQWPGPDQETDLGRTLAVDTGGEGTGDARLALRTSVCRCR